MKKQVERTFWWRLNLINLISCFKFDFWHWHWDGFITHRLSISPHAVMLLRCRSCSVKTVSKWSPVFELSRVSFCGLKSQTKFQLSDQCWLFWRWNLHGEEISWKLWFFNGHFQIWSRFLNDNRKLVSCFVPNSIEIEHLSTGIKINPNDVV